MPFQINHNKGFLITFENGFGLSVQFGPGNYCEHHNDMTLNWDSPKSQDYWKSELAEIAIIAPHGGFYRVPGEHDDVVGWQTAKDVAKWIAYTKGLSNEPIHSKDD